MQDDADRLDVLAQVDPAAEIRDRPLMIRALIVLGLTTAGDGSSPWGSGMSRSAAYPVRTLPSRQPVEARFSGAIPVPGAPAPAARPRARPERAIS